ncbi:hypothetical protein SAMN05444415_101538 [Salipiger profundus]|nr:hypothetical protein SAMN05444415_101538 [Salipiger profundus]
MSSQPNSNDEHGSRAQHCGGRIGYHIHDLGSVNDQDHACHSVDAGTKPPAPSGKGHSFLVHGFDDAEGAALFCGH